MDPWRLIGWAIIVAVVGLPLLGWLLQRIGRGLLWLAQREDRKQPPKLYDRWTPIWGGPVYRITQAEPIVISTDPNNLGGFYTSRSEWNRMVERLKLVRIS